MKQVIVGTYDIGYEQCELVLQEGYGGSSFFIPEKGSIPRIKVGAESPRWVGIMQVIMHESIEFALARYGCKYNPSQDISGASEQCVMVMTHAQFTKCIADSAEFISACEGDLEKAWKAWHKPPKKKPAKKRKAKR